jgi:hypothetical protein
MWKKFETYSGTKRLGFDSVDFLELFGNWLRNLTLKPRGCTLMSNKDHVSFQYTLGRLRLPFCYTARNPGYQDNKPGSCRNANICKSTIRHLKNSSLPTHECRKWNIILSSALILSVLGPNDYFGLT